MLIAVTVGVINSCVPSENPLYDPEHIVVDDRLVGEWWQPKGETPWAISRGKGDDYELNMIDRGGEGRFLCKLVKLDDKLFLDVRPDERHTMKHVSLMYRFLMHPTHSFFYIREIAPALQMAPLDTEWLKRFINDHPSEVSYRNDERDSSIVVLTMQTKALQAFVIKHLDAFSDFSEMKKK